MVFPFVAGAAAILCPQIFVDITEPFAIHMQFFARRIGITMATYNIGVLDQKSYTNGVIVFVCKAYMLAAGL